MNNAPSVSAESLDAALAHQAPHLVRMLDQVLRRFTELERQVVPLDDPLDIDPDDLLRRLAEAVNRRAYVATKRHDQAVAAILDDWAHAARARFGYLSQIEAAASGGAQQCLGDGICTNPRCPRHGIAGI